MAADHGSVRLLDSTVARSIHCTTAVAPMPPSSTKAWLAAALFIVPLCLNLSLAWRWSLDDDEFYTLRDSRQPVGVILKYHKPLYYLIVHYTLQLPLSEEMAIRLPAAIAGSLIPLVFYLLLAGISRGNTPLYAALLSATNPWLFDYSQFGRFYTLMFLLTAIACLCLYRWVLESRSFLWLGGYLISALAAMLTHTTAVVVLPAGFAAVAVYFACWRPQGMPLLIRRHRWKLIGTLLLTGTVSAWLVQGVLLEWLSARYGKFGGYPVLTLIRTVVGLGGLQVWVLAFLPLLAGHHERRPERYFLGTMVLCSILPYLFLAPFGGGIASRYLMQALPCLFVLGAIHWDVLARQLPSAGFRFALAGVIFAFYLPYDLSNFRDGNHCDYRQAVRFVESLELPNPIIGSTSHHLYEYYADPGADVHELGFLTDLSGGKTDGSSKPGRSIAHLIEKAEESGRPLVLVSRQFWDQPDRQAVRWLGERFATLAVIEKPRFDHRRNQLVIFEYRPSARASGTPPSNDAPWQHQSLTASK